MVVRNPFLCEKDHDIQFITRNEGAYRGLGSLFPAASLAQIAGIAIVCKEKRLYSSRYVYRDEYKDRRRLRSEVTQATKTLNQELGSHITHSTYQNYLNLECDLRIMRQMTGEYILHSYGIPLVATARLKNWTFSSEISKDTSLICYFIDRLLFEDGDYMKAILKLVNEGTSGKTSRQLGIEMHDMVFEQLKDRLNSQRLPYTIRNFIGKKIDEYEKTRRKSDRSLRRTELEYTVRRDWLRELQLLEMSNEEVSFTEQGNKLFKNVVHQRMDNSFFTDKLFSVLAQVYGMRNVVSSRLTKILENAYKELTNGRSNIVETLVLVNTALFSQIPFFIGERAQVLDHLKKELSHSRTALILQSGYRTKDYYVKLKL